MKHFSEASPEQQQALTDYKNDHGPKWKEKLISDWLSDHRRQWGTLRGVRNQVEVPMDEFLETVPRGRWWIGASEVPVLYSAPLDSYQRKKGGEK